MGYVVQVERLRASGKENNGCQTWNQWRKRHPRIVVDLSRADFWDAPLGGADLTRADLTGADLRRADLTGVDFTGANLVGADLGGADLHGVDLADGDLRGVNLSEALLEGTNMQACQLHGVRFTAPVQGEPLWPELAASEWDALQEEARSPTTPAARLAKLAMSWPGYQVLQLLVGNPNLPQEQVIAFAPRFPAAFLANPVLPWWFMEDPNWLLPWQAREVLERAQQELEWPALAQQYVALVALLERRAGQNKRG